MWNSPDGKQWSPPEEQSLPIVYTTFYVKPSQVLKGEPKWGTPVAFRATGVIQRPTSQNRELSTRLSLGIGDRVVVFGSIEDRYGPRGFYKPPEAYWLLNEENSLWVELNAQFVNLGHTKFAAERALPRSSIVSQVSGYAAQQQ